MNNEEAIARLQVGIHIKKEEIKNNKVFFPKHDNSRLEEDIEVYETAISAIEKQISKKVKIKKWSPSVCPSCGYELSESIGDGYYRHPVFLEICPKCYQRLDWSDSD